MKKLYMFLAFALLSASSLLSQNFVVDGIAYNITSTEVPYTVEVTSKTPNYEAKVIIPEQIIFEEIIYSVAAIGDWAFYNNTGVTSIQIPNSVTSIGDFAIFNCTGLKSLELSNSITSIGKLAFRSCTGLTSLELPNSLTNIGDYAFEFCTGLTSVEIPSSVIDVGQGAFLLCSALTTIIVDSENQHFSSLNGVLYNKDKTVLIIHPEGKEGNFSIPNSVTKIGNSAFSNCTNLPSIDIPNSVKTIGSFAFSRNNHLTTIEIPNSVTDIGYEAFRNCTQLTAIIVDDENQHYSSLDGVLYHKDKTVLIRYPEGKEGDFKVPDLVMEIENFAFWNCNKLTAIEISKSVISFGYSVFPDCTGLTSITVDAENPFYSSIDGVLYNKNKTVLIRYPRGKGGDFTIPDSVTEIESEAFYWCTGLISIEIPSSVTTIGYFAFEGCSGVTFIICYAENPPGLEYEVFHNVSKEIPLYVPEASVSSYQQADQWKDFNITALVITLNINTTETHRNIDLYPNPVSDLLNIDLGTYDGEVTFEIFNAAGQFILSGKVAETKIINTSGFEQGIYIIKLNGENWVEARRFVKK